MNKFRERRKNSRRISIRAQLEDQISAIKNIKKLHNGWEKVKFYNDYAGMVSKADYKAIHREGLKILTSKQMLQRLALAQVNTVNAS